MNLFHIAIVADRDMPKDAYNAICFWFTTFFVSEMFWMPGCVSYVGSPSDTMWWLLFIQLKISGISAILWAWENVKLAMDSSKENGGAKGYPWIGAIGAIMFT